ncbi:MAG: hypothetical protein HW416_937 [Chloroflexi bacterium]|nr:hypothetical protein [Chloroflexota bacterium]
MTLSLGSSIVAPALPVYARSFDVTFGEASLVLIAYSVGQLAFSVPTGFLIDRFGRRRVLLAGPIVLAVASVGAGLAGTFPLLVAFRFLAGCSHQMWMLSRLTVIADAGVESQRGRQVMGMVGMESSGRLLGPALGGFLAALIDVRAPFFLQAALTLLAIAPSFFLIKDTTPMPAAGRRGGQAGSSGTLAMLLTWSVAMFFLAQLFANLTRGATMSGQLHLYAVYAFGVGPETVGLLASAAGLVGLPIIFSTGYLMDRFGRTATVVPGFTLTGISMAVMAIIAVTDGPFSVYVPAFLALQFSQSLTAGNMQVIATLVAPERARGRFFGIWRVAGEGGSAASPALFALVAAHASYGASFAMLAAFSIFAALVLGTQVRGALKRLNQPIASPAA